MREDKAEVIVAYMRTSEICRAYWLDNLTKRESWGTLAQVGVS
jgi:hypothetical protein